MPKSRKTVSSMQLKEIYRLHRDGKTSLLISSLVGVDYATVIGAIKYIKLYVRLVLSGEYKTKKFMRSNYLSAAKWAVAQDKITRTATENNEVDRVFEKLPQQFVEVDLKDAVFQEIKPQTPPSTDRYQKLNLSFGVFSDAIYSFIDQEVQNRVSAVIEENTKLKEIVDAARFGNWAEELKKRMQK